MSGKSKTYKDAETQTTQARAERAATVAEIKEPTAAEKKFNEGAANWDKFVAGKDYSTPPAGELLNFDLFSPARRAKQVERAMDLTGTGGIQLGIGAGNSAPAELAKMHLADQIGESGAMSYENAIHSTDDYYKGNALNYAQFGQNRLATLLGDAASRENLYQQVKVQTAPKPLLPQILGAGLGVAGSLLGGFMTGGASMAAGGLNALSASRTAILQ